MKDDDQQMSWIETICQDSSPLPSCERTSTQYSIMIVRTITPVSQHTLSTQISNFNSSSITTVTLEWAAVRWHICPTNLPSMRNALRLTPLQIVASSCWQLLVVRIVRTWTQELSLQVHRERHLQPQCYFTSLMHIIIVIYCFSTTTNDKTMFLYSLEREWKSYFNS